jgi:8-oxo-dGTP diphosphatase
MARLLARIWKLLRGSLQWHILWLAHDKFIIGVSGVLLNDSGEILLLRHRYWKAGSWGLPSGYTNKREKLEDALAREVREETGYTAETLSQLRLVSGYKLRLEVSFLGRITGGTFKMNPKEILEARFFPPDQLPEGLLESHRELLRLALPGLDESSSPLAVNDKYPEPTLAEP